MKLLLFLVWKPRPIYIWSYECKVEWGYDQGHVKRETLQMNKLEKEQHVSGHSGSSIWEIQLVLVVNLLAYWINKLVWLKIGRVGVWTQYCIEYLLLVLPIIISSAFSSWNYYIIVTQLSAIFLLTKTGSLDKKKGTQPMGNHEPFVVAFRGYLQLITIFAILAVDFHIFPRKFAKCESFGTSLVGIS